jgi:hypothetical protein
VPSSTWKKERKLKVNSPNVAVQVVPTFPSGPSQVPTAPSAMLSKSNGTALALFVIISRTARSKT